MAENRDRVNHKARILTAFEALTQAELMEKIEYLELLFPPIGKSEDMFDDPDLNTSGGLLDLELDDGQHAEGPA